MIRGARLADGHLGLALGVDVGVDDAVRPGFLDRPLEIRGGRGVRQTARVHRAAVERQVVTGVRLQAVRDAEVVLTLGVRDLGAERRTTGARGGGHLDTGDRRLVTVLHAVGVGVEPDAVAELDGCEVAERLEVGEAVRLAPALGVHVADQVGVRVAVGHHPATGPVEPADATGVDVRRVHDRVGHPGLAVQDGESTLGGLLVGLAVGLAGEELAVVVLDHAVDLTAAVVGRGVVVGAVGGGAFPGVAAVGLPADPVEVATAHGVERPRRPVRRREALAALVTEAVPERQDEVAVRLDADVGQQRLRVHHERADGGRLLVGGLPGPPVIGAGASPQHRAAQDVQRVSDHRCAESARGERPYHDLHVGDVLRRLTRADATDVEHAVAHGQCAGPPVSGVGAGRGDRVGALRRTRGRRRGVVDVELLVTQVDNVELAAILGDVDVAQRFLADHVGETTVEVVLVVVLGGTGVGHGGEQRRRTARGGRDVDTAGVAAAVVGEPFRERAGEDPLVLLAVRDAVHRTRGALVRDLGRSGARAAVREREGDQRSRGVADVAAAVLLAGRPLAAGDERRVGLAVVGRVPQRRRDADVLTARDVDEHRVALEPVARGGGLEHAAGRWVDLHAVLAAAHRAEADGDVAVRARRAGRGLARGIGHEDGGTGHTDFEGGLVRAVRVDVTNDLHGQRAVTGTGVRGWYHHGERGGHQRTERDSERTFHEIAPKQQGRGHTLRELGKCHRLRRSARLPRAACRTSR